MWDGEDPAEIPIAGIPTWSHNRELLRCVKGTTAAILLRISKLCQRQRTSSGNVVASNYVIIEQGSGET